MALKWQYGLDIYLVWSVCVCVWGVVVNPGTFHDCVIVCQVVFIIDLLFWACVALWTRVVRFLLFSPFSTGHRLIQNTHTHTHIHALTHTRSLTDVPVSDYDLIPGKEGTKSPDMLICVHGDYHDFSLEGGCLWPQVIERQTAKTEKQIIPKHG